MNGSFTHRYLSCFLFATPQLWYLLEVIFRTFSRRPYRPSFKKKWSIHFRSLCSYTNSFSLAAYMNKILAIDWLIAFFFGHRVYNMSCCQPVGNMRKVHHSKWQEDELFCTFDPSKTWQSQKSPPKVSTSEMSSKLHRESPKKKHQVTVIRQGGGQGRRSTTTLKMMTTPRLVTGQLAAKRWIPRGARSSELQSSIFRGLLLLHPWSLTWNLRIHPWKRKIIFQTIIFKFYVKLRGCSYKDFFNHLANNSSPSFFRIPPNKKVE